MTAKAGPFPMRAEVGQLQQTLLDGQNRDGGWPFEHSTADRATRNSSWTEPTALALLALAAEKAEGSAHRAGCLWLRNTQKPDGGWAPRPDVDTSTSVTSLAALALCETGADDPGLGRGAQWILSHEYQEPPMLERFALRLLGASPPKAPGGSPWFPGTAAWIAPTAMSVLALSRFALLTPSQSELSGLLRPAIRRAQDYILSRKCRDGGWNHGGSAFRSENAESYPEMTGLALLALPSAPAGRLDEQLSLAAAFLNRPQPASASSWLQLALLKHGIALQAPTEPPVCRNYLDVCLRLLALAAIETGALPQSLAA